ncbi:MAG: tRNA (cytidine(34)-2'-O)-methyltransferase [Bacillota bacterium]|nr:tRNA (cytidine(34)-2'-O)-methyltransferase [Bacillota bacterium]
MAMHIVMVEPEIPPNTGNVARSCAATGSVLHLVKPLGFSIDDKSLKRAGLDYWPYVDVRVHESLPDFMAEYEGEICPQTGEPYRMFLATTKGARLYTDAEFRDGDMILFGRETAGLPRDFIDEQERQHPGCSIRIPMSESTRLRSFNLSNSVNIILFEALRQQGFPGLE